VTSTFPDHTDSSRAAGSIDDRPWEGRELHLVGIGGCGMSGLALLASHLGATVTGSDQKESIFTASLQGDPRIVVTMGHDASNVPPGAELVYSSAVKEDNPERARARGRGQVELHRSGLIAQLTQVRRTIAVAGAHGKTTTSALLAHVLTESGMDPSYIVGGLMRPPAAHARVGHGDLLVIEADESDRTLLHYDVDVAVVTNIDLDHVGDVGGFTNRQDVADLLRTFVAHTQALVTTPEAAAELDVAGINTIAPAPITSTGTSAGTGTFTLDGHGYRLNLPGLHNVTNAGLVVATALHVGCAPAQIDAALASFPGLKRRFELRGTTTSGARVFDDYAHHPAEVSAAIDAARTLTDGPVIAVFQPHLFSRTEQFAAEFAGALAKADLALLDAIYPARETQQSFPHVTSAIIADRAPDGAGKLRYIPDTSALLDLVHRHASSADALVLLVGAGDIGRLAGPLLGTPRPEAVPAESLPA
jgi:UDP-N-acetylmuramate--alanine ligase